jgi:hypothetical protein
MFQIAIKYTKLPWNFPNIYLHTCTFNDSLQFSNPMKGEYIHMYIHMYILMFDQRLYHLNSIPYYH